MLPPRINDITTTPEAPPVFRALEREPANLGRDMKYPAHFAPLQAIAYPDLRPLRSDLPAEQLFELVQAAALDMRTWAIASTEPGRLSLEAIAIMPVLRFKSDIVIQVRPDAEGKGACVHMRSKSRLGRGDLGANAKRIRAFFDLLRRKLTV